MVPRVSIIIRTKNEEDWIYHCLQQVLNQTVEVSEIIVVDNGSNDNTLNICKTFSKVKILKIKKYLPGLSLNKGIEKSNGDIIVLLSAHCIPKDNKWLERLINPFSNPKICGVYGRQIPISYSSAKDIRDLFITFGSESRLQRKDSFFHNANSAIRRSVWKRIKFDNNATNIEDRIWAKEVLSIGYHLKYQAKAVVFHHHGIHHDQNLERARSTLNVINTISEGYSYGLPDSMKPESSKVYAIIPVPHNLNCIAGINPIDILFKELSSSRFIKDIVFIHNDSKIVANLPKSLLHKSPMIGKNSFTLVDIIADYLKYLTKKNTFPDYILYSNPEYFFRPANAFDILIEKGVYGGFISTTFGLEDYNDYWLKDESSQNYQSIHSKIVLKNKKIPMLRSLFGIGSLVKPHLLTKGSLAHEGNQGMIILDKVKYSLRVNIPSEKEIIESLVK